MPLRERENTGRVFGHQGDDYTDEETEWLAAVEKYKTEKRRPFPSMTELLELFKSLGYRKAPQ